VASSEDVEGLISTSFLGGERSSDGSSRIAMVALQWLQQVDRQGG